MHNIVDTNIPVFFCSFLYYCCSCCLFRLILNCAIFCIFLFFLLAGAKIVVVL